MATKDTIEFKYGDAITHYFRLPEENWVAGGALYFTAKPSVDNDNTDARAVINRSFSDANIVDSSHPKYIADKVTYELPFIPADIVNVSFADGNKKKKYLGEFQFTPSGGYPATFPGNDNYIETIIYADIKRGT